MERIDNSILTTWAGCKTAGAMEYIYHRRADDGGKYVMAGNGFHAARAQFWRGWDTETCLKAFDDFYKDYSAMAGVEEGICWANMRDIMKECFDRRPVGKYPFEPVAGLVEEGISADLGNGIELWAKIDCPARDKESGIIVPVDSKGRMLGALNEWWTGKFKGGSQLTGYIWALAQRTGQFGGVGYVDVVRFHKLPDASERKCRVHKIPQKDCRLEHCEWQLLKVRRTETVVKEWLRIAQRLAREFLMVKKTIEGDIRLVHGMEMDGKFTGACLFCQFKSWCHGQDRDLGVAEGMRVEEWRPWEERKVA